MKKDLDLNGPHHILERGERKNFIEFSFRSYTEDSPEEMEFLERITARDHSLSSFNRKVVEDLGFEIED